MNTEEYADQLSTETNADRLATYGQQVSEEAAEKSVRGKMSEPALAKLRAIKEQEKLEAIDSERFKNMLRSVVVSPGNLRTLIERCNTTPVLKDRGWMDGGYKHHKFVEILPVERQIDRMVQKLTWWIEAGYLLGREIDTGGLVNFFSNLTVVEVKMSDSQFSSAWNDRDARKRKEARLGRGLISKSNEEPVYRPCKSARKCLRFEKRKPAPAKGTGDYCSPACAASNKARQKRSLAASPSAGIIQ